MYRVNIEEIFEQLRDDVNRIDFSPPISHVYNPLEYANKSHDKYLQKYSKPPKEVILVGMNPGPWGMAQTGVPFGDVVSVRDWLEIEAPIQKPKTLHPKRPVIGFSCTRREVSGTRIWGWAETTFSKPETFFNRFFISNYCPLLFIGEHGRNITPDKLKKADKKTLFKVCDKAIRGTVEILGPAWVVGVGRFAWERCEAALDGMSVRIGRITHPSPANPKANRGWDTLVNHEFREMGIQIWKGMKANP